MPTAAGIPLHASYSYVVVGYGAAPTNPNGASDTTFFVVDNTQCDMEAMGIPDDVTTSYNTLGTRAFTGLIHPRITITLPEDDVSSLESATLVVSSYYTVWMRRGNSSTASHQWDKVANACFMGLRKSRPTATGGKITMIAEFEGGDYTGYTTPSSNMATYIAGLSPVRT